MSADHQNIIGEKTVRIRDRREDGFVEFDFSIGDPQLFVELILPEPAFKEFCANNQVRELTAEEAAQIDAYIDRWVEPAFDNEADEDTHNQAH